LVCLNCGAKNQLKTENALTAPNRENHVQKFAEPYLQSTAWRRLSSACSFSSLRSVALGEPFFFLKRFSCTLVDCPVVGTLGHCFEGFASLSVSPFRTRSGWRAKSEPVPPPLVSSSLRLWVPSPELVNRSARSGAQDEQSSTGPRRACRSSAS